MKQLLALPILVVILVSLPGCSYHAGQTKALLEDAGTQTYDLIVVPGVPLENGKWSNIMKARIYWSKYLYDKGIAKNIMYSGSAVYTPYVEAEVMAMYAEAIGIPKENIFTESKAEHSTENIFYSYKKARKLNFKRIALASDPFQTRMLKRFTREKVSPDVDFIPIVFDTLRAMEPTMIDPQINYQTAMVDSFVPLPERKGFFERMRGTMGKHVDPAMYD